MIKEAKFGRNETKASALFSYWFKKTTRTDVEKMVGLEPFDAVSFVPIHWRRRAWRGFDMSSLFARSLAKKMRIPLRDLLISKKYNLPLTLSQNKEERYQIVKDRFELRQPLKNTLNILLVDDVVTTGTTLQMSSNILLNAGHRIKVLAFAGSSPQN